MTNYTRGRQFEYRVARALVSDGYLVIRAAGSKGKADLWAAKPGELLMVQAKGGSAGVGPAEWNLLYADACRVGAVPLVALRDGRKLVLMRMTAAKDSPGRQPWVLWTADRVEAAS